MWGKTQEECFISCDPYTAKNLGFKVLSLEYGQKPRHVALSIK